LNTEYSDKISAIRGFTNPTAGTFKLNDGTVVPNYVKAMNDFEAGYDGRLTNLENGTTKAGDSNKLAGYGYSHFKTRWQPYVKKNEWSRVARLRAGSGYGGSYIFTIQHTTGNTVMHNVFLVTHGHSNHGQIVMLGTHGYTQIKLRLTGVPEDTSGSMVYLEMSGTQYVETNGAWEIIRPYFSAEKIDGSIDIYDTGFISGVIPHGTEVDGNGNPLDVATVRSEVATSNNNIYVDGHKVYHSGNTVVDENGFIKIP
jgi:hypothetical protein